MSEVSQPPQAADPILVAEGIEKSFQLGRTRLDVLRGCSLSLAAGEFVAIMGKSGSGKSTLLHILGALDVPQSGQVHFRGTPVFAAPAQRRIRTNILDVFDRAERHRIRLRGTAFGFVFQFYHLLPELNVLENVMLARMVSTKIRRWRSVRREVRHDALQMLERVGLQDRLRHRPNELSGGERQRVAIARALVHRPPVLLADEPTGNLDAESGRSILELLSQLHAEGQTLVLVTHDPGVATYADRTLVLERGGVRASDMSGGGPVPA